MKHSYYRFILYLFICAISSYSQLYPCIVTFFNNGTGSALILDHNNSKNKSRSKQPPSLVMVPRAGSRRIGKSDEHAHFTIYTKPPKSKIFIATYEIQQNECGKNGNPYLTMSDIRQRTGETNLFTITEISKNHTSMVRQLSSIKKADIYKEDVGNGCAACNQ